MEQRLYKIVSQLAQEFPRISGNIKVHYSFHKIPLILSILRQLNPVYLSSFQFQNVHFNIILPLS